MITVAGRMLHNEALRCIVGTAWTFILEITSIYRISKPVERLTKTMGRYAEIDSRKAGYDGELSTELIHVCAKWRGLVLVTWNVITD